MPARSALGGLSIDNAAAAIKASISRGLALSGLDDQRAAGREPLGRLRNQGAIGVIAVLAAVERQMRIVLAHLDAQFRNFPCGNIGRVRHDQIERAASAAA